MLSDCSALTESLGGHRLLEDAAYSETVRDLVPRFETPQQLAEELVRRGWLTAFQKELILAGKAEELVLGPYVLTDKIGEGGMGAVFKARHRILKAVRAIKVIRPDRLSGSKAVERFYREAEVVAKLHHPNIILAHDAGQYGKVHCFVMEFAHGVDLGQLLLRCGPLPVADACEYIRQAAVGLEHAHERGLIHRDIKPSNLLVTTEGRLKILDLGLARLRLGEEETSSAGSLTQDGAVMGTPDYMAPEQAEDSRRVDIRADVYSLGCTLYHVLTGRPPYPGGSVMEKLVKHRLEEPRPVEALRADVPQGLAAIIRKMTAKDPAARFQTPAEVAAALQPFCEGAGRAGLSLPQEMPCTLLPGMIPPLPVGPTPAPGGSMEHTATGQRGEDAPTEAFRARPVRGSTERLPAEPPGLVPTQLPLAVAGIGAGPRPPSTLPTGLQETVIAPPKSRRGLLVAALVLGALGLGGGALLLLPRFTATPPEPERRAELAAATPRAEKPAAGPAVVAAANANPAGPATDDKPRAETAPVAPTPPAPPAKGQARGLTGDRAGVAAARAHGPPVRTGGRGLSWDRRRELYALAPYKARKAAFALDGSRVAFGTPSDVVLTYGLRDNKPDITSLGDLTAGLTDGSAHVNAVAVSPEGNRLLLATVGRSATPLDGNPVTTKYNMLIAWEPGGTPQLVYGPRLDVGNGFRGLAYSPDGQDVLAAGALPQVYAWKAGAGNLRPGRRYFRHGGGDVVNAVAFGPEGRLAATAGVDKQVCVFDVTKPGGEPLTTLQGMHSSALCAALSGGGHRYALAGGRDGKACLWDVGDEPAATVPNPAQVLAWHDKDASVTAVAFAPSGRQFVTGGDDGTVCLGEVGKPQPLWRETPRAGGGAALALAFSADGRHVFVADEAGLGEYPVERDVLARGKPLAAGAEAEGPPAEAKGR